MKKNSIIILILVLFLVSCSQTTSQKLRLELALPPVFDISPFSQLALSDFLITESPEGLDTNQHIVEYLESEIGIQFPLTVSYAPTASLSEDSFSDPSFWKNLLKESDNALILTGRAEYQADTRKAFTSIDKKKLETPFPSESKTYRKGFFTLNMDFFLIEASSGEIVYQKTFKETRSSQNIKQKASFTLYELLNSIKIKLFRQLAGGSLYQERYLILK